MRKILCLLAFISLLPGVSLAVYSTEHHVKTLNLPSGTYRYVDREILIQPEENVSISELNVAISSYGDNILDTDCLNNYGFTVVSVQEGLDLLQARDELKQNPLIKSASLI